MFCPKCGTNVSDDFNFCYKCGFDFTPFKQSIANEENISSQTNSSSQNLNSDEQPSAYVNASLPSREEELREKYYQLCFVDKDFRNLLALQKEIEKENLKIEIKYNLVTDPFYFITYDNYNKFGVISSIYKNIEDVIGYDKFGYPELVDLATLSIISTYWVQVTGKTDYDTMSFIYNWHKDIERYDQIDDILNSLNEELDKRILLDEHTAIKDKYNNDFSYANYVQQILDCIDLKHLSINISRCASLNANIISTIYIKILDNAIKYHNAEFLQKMYPSSEHQLKLSSLIESEIINQFQKSTRNLALTLQKSEACIKRINQINELNKKTDSNSILKKGLVSAGISLIALPLGIANGIREGYNYYESTKKIKEFENELEKEFSSFIDEYRVLLSDMTKADENLKIRLADNIMNKILVPSIKNIMAQLKANNITVLPLHKYLMP